MSDASVATKQVLSNAGVVPRPSLAERDRRHALIRQAMAKEGLDVLVLSPNTARWGQMMADTRYVTAIGGFATEVLAVVPREGDITAYVYNRAAWWAKEVDWVADVRDGRNKWGENVVERVRELGLEKGRIGFSGLSGLARAPSGTITYDTVETVKAAFPGAEIVNATALMQEVRTCKSDEEVALLETSAGIVEKMIDVCVANARPGAVEKTIYGLMTATLLANDGELPNFLLFASGPNLKRSSFAPTSRVIESGDRIVNEIEAKYAGYGAQAVAPMVVGKPDPLYKEMVRLSGVCFEAILAAMKPGATFGDLQKVYAGVVAQEGKGRFTTGIPMMHARGLGDDGPALLRKSDVESFQNTPLQKGMTFILKPRLIEVGGKERASLGDTVAVTANGAKRLGKRPLELITID
ncbi:MAG TPA: M24 family metallopeptidase [Alphaproteobacteria bacterium]|jgi:Xaa-Pro aminopeptidase